MNPPPRHAVHVSLLLTLLFIGSYIVVSGWSVTFAALPTYPDGQAATLVLGRPTFTVRDDPVGPNWMNVPYAVVVDPLSGAVFVADTGHSRVLRFDSMAAFTDGAAATGVLGQPDFTSTAHSATQDGISFPNGLAMDNFGRLWVADSDANRVLRYDNAASKPNGAPADGVLGQVNFTDTTAATSATGMSYPFGIALDGEGSLWVVDAGNSRILRFDNAANKPNGASADGVLGQADFITKTPGVTATGLGGPTDVDVDAEGRLWVADKDSSRILRYDDAANKPNGAPADGVLGQPDFVTSIQAQEPTASGLYNPFSLAVDNDGRLWVADSFNQRVLRYDDAANKANGAPADGVLGQPDFVSSGYNNVGVPNQIGEAYGITVDSEGRLWVADVSLNRVVRFDQAATKPNGAPADGVLGRPTLTSTWIVEPTARSQWRPEDVAVDSEGRVWVADSFGRVLRYRSIADLTNGAAAEGVLGEPDFRSSTSPLNEDPNAANFGSISSITVDNAGRLWVADSVFNRVLRFDDAANKPNGAPADAVLGQVDFTTTEVGTTASTFGAPRDTIVDASGRLWVVDGNNNRVLRFDDAANKPNGAPADGVLGQADFTSKTVTYNYPWDPTPIITSSGMYFPDALALDGQGTLWVADSSHHRVLRFDDAANKPNGAPADGVLGQPDFSSAVEAINASGMRYPSGLVVDSGGRLWVADSGNNRIVRFDDAATKPNGASADGVLGQVNFTSRTISEPPTASSLLPRGLAVDADDHLWVADSGNNRTLYFGPPPPTITWPDPEPISYGMALSAAQLNAATDAPGTLTYTPPVGKVLPAGEDQSLQVVFTPVDPTVYRTVTRTVTLDVYPASLIVQADDTERWVGMPNPTFTATLDGFVHDETADVLSGTLTFTTPATNASPAGEYPIVPGGLSSSNYTISFVTGTLTIRDTSAPGITWPVPDSITYGTALGDPQLNATADVPGTFTYTPAAGTVLDAGTDQQLHVAFTPDDRTRYAVVTATVPLDVTPADLSVRADDQTRPFRSPEPVFTATLEGLVHGDTIDALSGTLTITTTATEVSPPGAYPIVPSGLSSPNYTITFEAGTLTITPPRGRPVLLPIGPGRGGPGSVFGLQGQDLPPGISVALSVNGVIMGYIPVDAEGNLLVAVVFAPQAAEGTYTIALLTPSTTGAAPATESLAETTLIISAGDPVVRYTGTAPRVQAQPHLYLPLLWR